MEISHDIGKGGRFGMKNIRTLIDKYYDKVVAYRRHIHAHPELSMEETGTARFIAEQLRAIGLTPVEGVGGNGVVAVVEGARPGRCVGLRADIDALPIQETTGLPYASQNEGVSHSCGHDMHTAMLLGCAHVLYELRGEMTGAAKLVFQPAEESVLSGGAPDMIADGVLENPFVDAMLGQHIWPSLPTGTAAIRNGPMMASSDRFFITVKGKSSHGSAPEEGVDAVAIAAQVVTALQTIVSRNVSPIDSAVVTVGTIHGGDRYNVVAGEVKMEGTCRNLNPAVRDRMPARIEGIVRGVTEGMGGRYEFTYCRGYSPTVNDAGMFALVYGVMKEQLGENAQIPASPALGGEDFSFYCEQRPSAFFWLGCRDPQIPFERCAPIHNGGLCPQEESMKIGMEVMIRSALRFLED